MCTSRGSGGRASRHGIIVVGALAIGVEALEAFVHGLAPDLPAAAFVVLHHSAPTPNVLTAILNRFGPLPAHLAHDNERFHAGQIYVVPNDAHLLITPGEMKLSHAPPVNGVKPGVDPLFSSAAQAYGPQAIGVVLSGLGHDGTTGLEAIKEAGGFAVVQDPADALFPSMLQSASEHVVDYSLPAVQLGETVSDLVQLPVSEFDVSQSEALDGRRS